MATHNIEDSELRGVTVKLATTFIRWLIGAVVFLTVTGSGAFLKLQSHFDKYDSNIMMQELKNKTIDITLEKLQTEIEMDRTQLQTMQLDLMRVKAKLNLE